jgi:hypothetical protein
MTLHIRHLKLQIVTSGGLFGIDLPFETGLFILHADNTSGKSTCLNSIIYALGLEGMLSPSQRVPLPQVVTDLLNYNDEIYEVLESEVLLEISNGTDIMTVRRQIKGSQNRHLINVWNGPMLSQTITSYMVSDYIVRASGGASRERGFHHLLATFVGWQLPNVPTYDENEVPLYVETLFPFMFVEQKHGWSNLRNRFPTYLRIKDINRRAFEFILSFDSQEIATQKIVLRQKAKDIEASWSATFQECEKLIVNINGIVNNLPKKPISTWPPSTQPGIMIIQNDEWHVVNEVLLVLEKHLRSIENQEVPTVEQASESVRCKLEEKQEQLLPAEIKLKLKFEEVESQSIHIEEIQLRISSLREDLLKNRDLKKISNLGSVQELHTYAGECPICRQSISDSLISTQEVITSMTIDQNVDFIQEQLKIFEAMLQSEVKNLSVNRTQLNSLKSYTADIRDDIRALKSTLTSQNNAPSYAAIEERIRLAEKIRYIKFVRNQIDELLGDFSHLSKQWGEIQAALAQLPKGILSDEDNRKINCLEKSFQRQLQEYGFESLAYCEVNVSCDSYFPEHEGFDLQFNLSASDYIRVIWAYLLGLLEVSREYQTNHLGLLILDEPRQQSARETSIEAFLNRVSVSQKHNQQVIIATSESKIVLDKYLMNIPHTYKRFDGKIIAPI